MPKVTLVEAYWPATDSKFLQAFEDYDKAYARYSELKSDSGASVQITKTEIRSLDDLGKMILDEVKEQDDK